MNKIFELGDKEKFKIIFSDDKLEFQNSSNTEKNGIYLFSEIKDVKLNKGSTLWIITLLSWFIEIFMGILIGNKYSKKRNIEILTKNERLTIWLSKSDLQNAEKIVELINRNKPTHGLH